MVIAVIALIVALTGTAFAALGKNTVGPRQLKSKSVTTAKFADEAVTADKVAKNTLIGSNFDLNQLGTVPNATHAERLGDTSHILVTDDKGTRALPATCPGGAILVRGLCFDAAPNGPIEGVKAAADACAQKGGRLPTPTQLLSVRTLINLGNGEGVHRQFTDSFVKDNFVAYTVVVDSSGIPDKPTEHPPKLGEGPESPVPADATYEYVCVYQLIR
jgi:hypothetical protein